MTSVASLSKRVTRHPLLAGAALLVLLAAIYWSLVASDRFVSEAHLVVDRTDLQVGPSIDFASLVTGGHSNSDLLLLRDHLRSVDMLTKLDAKLNLRAHYSSREHDVLSRMWSADTPQEFFHQHYLSRTSIEIDEQSGVLRVGAQAYDADTARRIASLLIEEGEAYLNELGHRLARDQVAFLEREVTSSNQRAVQTRQALLAFQNRTGMLSPQAKAENLAGIAARFEGQIADLKARRAGMLGYLSKQSPDVRQLDLQIDALEEQMQTEQARLTSPKGTAALNRSVEEFQRLELEATFAQDIYRTALTALERGRLEATRTLKKVSIVQSPTLPQYPLEPRRIYNLVVFALGALMLAGIIHLLAAIVRDHQD
jgi:capsular polysaccharide transport system permease protein